MFAYTGGKTGGHVMPLLSIIEENKEKAIYIGQMGNLEERLCKEKNILFVGIKGYSNKIKLAWKGYFELKKKLKNYKIDALISSGGYVSLSACLYAIRYRIPIFLLEENVVMGSLNKGMLPFCKKIFLAYDLNKKSKKYQVCGIPIRKTKPKTANIRYDVLIIGGSLGSKVLCDLAVQISNEMKVCLIAGNYAKDYQENEHLKIISFSTEIYTLMAESRIIIARAGASTTAEIFYMNKPFICVPSMKTKKNHQFYNAKYFSEKNACILCMEDDADKEILNHIHRLLENEGMCLNMQRAQQKLVVEDSAKKILSIVKENIK